MTNVIEERKINNLIKYVITCVIIIIVLNIFSWAWRSLLKGRNLLSKGCRWHVVGSVASKNQVLLCWNCQAPPDCELRFVGRKTSFLTCSIRLKMRLFVKSHRVCVILTMIVWHFTPNVIFFLLNMGILNWGRMWFQQQFETYSAYLTRPLIFGRVFGRLIVRWK